MLRRLSAGEAAMAAPIATQVLRFFNEPVEAPRSSPAIDDRRLDWQAHGTNPLRLSPGECRLLRLLAQGARAGEVATRLGLSIEAIGRRIAQCLPQARLGRAQRRVVTARGLRPRFGAATLGRWPGAVKPPAAAYR